MTIIRTAFATLEHERADALLVETNGVNVVNHGRIVPFAARNRMPTASPLRMFAADGGLTSYGPAGGSFQRAAVYVNKILKGAKPAISPSSGR